MSLARIKYGVEFDPSRKEEGSSGTGWILVGIALAAAVSFAFTISRRISAARVEERADTVAETPASESRERQGAGSEPSPAAAPPVEVADIGSRHPKVRSLLMRLDEAARKGDLEMQVTTIERIRSLPPGDAAADIAAGLTPRLGELNRLLLFERHDPRWVTSVEVKKGDSATRIAHEHGSTLASFLKLNGISDANQIFVGRRVKVMDHPRFNIVVHKRLRAVDLFLNGKLFARYLMPDGAPDVKWDTGDYKTPSNLTEFFRKLGIGLAPEGMAELDMLVPRDTSLNITAA